jgi:hypothetical protein
MRRNMIRSLLPISLAIIGLTLLVGCLYIPTFEEPTASSQPDFRDLVGNDPRHPIRPGYVDRRTVVLLLGQPQLESNDHKSIGYLFATHQGYWFWPLCFAGQEATRTEYGLRLDFRDDGVLRDFNVVHNDVDSGSLFSNLPYPVVSVIEKMNQSAPELLRQGYLLAPDYPVPFPRRNASTRPNELH